LFPVHMFKHDTLVYLSRSHDCLVSFLCAN